jgi:DNA-binding beta-propeller fold protein YncE
MQSRSTSVIIAALAAMVAASSVQAAGLKQVAEIAIPGDPITDIGIMAIDQTTGLGYLADKTNKSVVVFDTKADKYVSRIPGFMGRTKDGDVAGPNGVVVVKGEVWVSDGDSTIKIIDGKTGKVTETISTGGKKRANGMAYAEKADVVIVANSNDDPPYLSFISAAPGHKILGKVEVPESAENLERSAYHEPSGTFYTVIPVSRADNTKGLIAQTDPKSAKLVKLHQVGCHPHSLSLASESSLFLGCSSVHGPSPKPGGDMAIFDIATAKVETVLAGYGGNGGSTVNPRLGQYYHSTTGGELMVVDTKTKQGLQKVPTSTGARSLAVGPNDRVYVATTAKDAACRGCILVFAPSE